MVDAGVGSIAAGVEGDVEEANGDAAEERAKGLSVQRDANDSEKMRPLAITDLPDGFFVNAMASFTWARERRKENMGG